MSIKPISREEFVKILTVSKFNNTEFYDFLFDVYETSIAAIQQLVELGVIEDTTYINHADIVYYILGEFTYATDGLLMSKIKELIDDENFGSSMASVVADKYISLSVFKFSQGRVSNKYLPPESTLYLYLNFLLRTLQSHHKNDPNETLISDLLVKAVTISRCILNLANYGYESSAYATWRTLHECECTLLILAKYGDTAVKAYLRHMNYGIVFRQGAGSKEATDAVFMEIKDQMRAHDLKSKDMKKFIEYGWLYAINDFNAHPEYKLNFRDGMQPLSGLEGYKNEYVQSSELIHCTPLLIYSDKKYFYYVCILSLYESFFRLEGIFTKFLDQYIPKEAQQGYLDMKNVYFKQLVNIHRIESFKFRQLFGKPKPIESDENTGD